MIASIVELAGLDPARVADGYRILSDPSQPMPSASDEAFTLGFRSALEDGGFAARSWARNRLDADYADNGPKRLKQFRRLYAQLGEVFHGFDDR